MDISVVFSSYNGAGVLAKTLEGYTCQEYGSLRWEIIVVDNNSQDETPQILESYKSKIPLTVLKCETPGKNAALNSAIPHIKSDYVIVTDDDAVPATDFLTAWHAAFEQHKDYNLFGGTITPFFDFDVPEWMQESRFHFEEIYAQRLLDTGEIPATAIYGPNMAVRKSIFDEGLIFNEDVGPNSTNKNYPMGSETEFLRRVESFGHKAFFVSDAKVDHIVREHQISPNFWVKRAYRHGLGTGVQEVLSSQKKSFLKIPFYILKGIIRMLKAKIEELTASRHLDKAQAKWQFMWEKGYMAGKCRTAFSGE